MYRYFNWADKKLHSTSFAIDKKEDIDEDLLADFKEADHTVKTGTNQAKKVEKKAESKTQDKKAVITN